MFGITDKLAKRRARRIERELARQEAVKRTQREKQESDHRILASRAFMQYAEACQEEGVVEAAWFEEDGSSRFFIGLWSFFNPATKARETRVEVTDIHASRIKTYLVIFSQYAKYTYRGWLEDYRPTETSPSSPALRQAGGTHHSDSLYHCQSGSGISFLKEQNRPLATLVVKAT